MMIDWNSGGKIPIVYTIGVSQKRNCIKIPIICPTSLIKTFSIPQINPKAVENNTFINIIRGSQNIFIPTLKPMAVYTNITIIKNIKLEITDVITIIKGSADLGKYIFFIIFELSMNTVSVLLNISRNRNHP